MRIPDNRVGTIETFFRQELKGLYEPEEIRMITFLCFETFLGFKSPSDLVLHASDNVNQSDLLKFNFAAKELKKHRPVQYVLGRTIFYNCILAVNEQVLIPRPETEELVDMVIRENKGKAVKIVDIGTGSGCIAIALKKYCPEATVFALDISTEALKLAAKNAESNNVSIDFCEWDILDENKLWPGPVLDIIVSNPPYIDLSEKEAIAPHVKDQEPHLALFVNGDDVLLFYRKIVLFASQNLKPGGTVYFEINEAKGKEMVQLITDSGYEKIKLHQDLNGKSRMISASKKVF
jgi:release factor glutamine methyltransferase